MYARYPRTLRVMEAAAGHAAANGFAVEGMDFFAGQGPEGNIEFLMFVRKNDAPVVPDHARFFEAGCTGGPMKTWTSLTRADDWEESGRNDDFPDSEFEQSPRRGNGSCGSVFYWMQAHRCCCLRKPRNCWSGRISWQRGMVIPRRCGADRRRRWNHSARGPGRTKLAQTDFGHQSWPHRFFWPPARWIN